MKRYIVRGICILLLICSLVLLFMPSWLVNDESVSAAEYVLNPGEHKDVTKAFRGMMDSKKLTTRFALPIFVLLVINCFAIAFSVLKIRKSSSPLLTSLVGAIGVFAYLTNVLLKAGSFALIGPVLSVIMVAAGIAAYLIN